MLNFKRLILQRAASQDRRTAQKERQTGARIPVQVEAGEQIGGQDVFLAVVDAVVEDAGEVKVVQVARMLLVTPAGRKGILSRTVPKMMKSAASAEKRVTSS